MSRVRHLASGLGHLFAYGVDSGRWWLLVMTLVLGAVTAIGLAAKATVGVAVYVLF